MLDNIFEDIYKTGYWKDIVGAESGPGSSIDCSKQYLDFLQSFCVNNNIKSILDLGCGDFNLMRHFNFTNIMYHGIDVVDFVIQNNCIRYSKSNITFETGSIINYTPKQQYDLILCKDVLQHLSTNNIKNLLVNLKSSYTKHVLITNDYSDNHNLKINDGEYSSIDLSKEPYNSDGQFVFEWQSCYFLKKVFKYIS